MRKNPPRPPLPLISIGTMKKKILECLKDGGNPHSISRSIGRHRSTIQQHLKELSDMGLTEKSGYLWAITDLGNQYLGGGFCAMGYERGGAGITDWLQDRAHNIKIKTLISQKPDGIAWLNGWDPTPMKNNIFYRRRFGEVCVTYTGKSFIFQLPPMIFKKSEDAIANAGYIGVCLIKKYEAEIPGLRLGTPSVSAQLISQSHAIPRDPFAMFCVKHGISYHGENIDIDASKGPELEFKNNKDSHTHHERYVNHVEDIILNDVPTQSEMAKMIAQTQEQIQGLAMAQKEALASQVNTNNQLRGFIRASQLSIYGPEKPPEEPRPKLEGRPDYAL